MRHLSLAVVGVKFDNKPKNPTRAFAIQLLRPGDPVELRPEPKNPHDANAISVYDAAGVQLGYVKAERAPLINQFIRNGREIEAVFQGRKEYGCDIRLALDGAPMVLPDQPAPAPSLPSDNDSRTVVRDEWDQTPYWEE